MSALLSLRNIHTGYGSREIVRGASLAVEGGEFCALLGLNGCGKTTLLRAVVWWGRPKPPIWTKKAAPA